MVKYPEWDKRERFGSSSSGETPAASRVAATPKDTIAKFTVVMLQHKGTPFRVRVTKVLPPDRFEGHVLGALPPALEIEDLVTPLLGHSLLLTPLGPNFQEWANKAPPTAIPAAMTHICRQHRQRRLRRRKAPSFLPSRRSFARTALPPSGVTGLYPAKSVPTTNAAEPIPRTHPYPESLALRDRNAFQRHRCASAIRARPAEGVRRAAGSVWRGPKLDASSATTFRSRGRRLEITTTRASASWGITRKLTQSRTCRFPASGSSWERSGASRR
jgi:hypothetical protein